MIPNWTKYLPSSANLLGGRGSTSHQCPLNILSFSRRSGRIKEAILWIKGLARRGAHYLYQRPFIHTRSPSVCQTMDLGEGDDGSLGGGGGESSWTPLSNLGIKRPICTVHSDHYEYGLNLTVDHQILFTDHRGNLKPYIWLSLCGISDLLYS